ncbi:HD-GYP domain-containing protein [Candidatus Margulisiibacteriota bacterium]
MGGLGSGLKVHVTPVGLELPPTFRPKIDTSAKSRIMRAAGSSAGRHRFVINLKFARELLFGAVGALFSKILQADENTGEHCLRVAELGVLVARKLGITEDEDLAAIRIAGAVHDFGKTNPDILEQVMMPGRPTNFPLLMKHSGVGVIKMRRLGYRFPREIEDVIRYHHLRYDGGERGYPSGTGLKGDAIPLWVRIFTVVDSFDAMTTRRFRIGSDDQRPKTVDEAIVEMRKCAGGQFDPKVVAALIEVLQEGMLIRGEKNTFNAETFEVSAALSN